MKYVFHKVENINSFQTYKKNYSVSLMYVKTTNKAPFFTYKFNKDQKVR